MVAVKPGISPEVAFDGQILPVIERLLENPMYQRRTVFRRRHSFDRAVG